MYYRDTPDSCLFKSSEAGHAGGSAFCQRVMQAVLDEIGDNALPVLVQQAKNNIARVHRLFLGTEDNTNIPTNLLCTCAAGGASLACCAEYDSAKEILFGTRDATRNLQTAVMENLLDSVVDSPLLSRDIWTKQEFAPPPQHRPASASRPSAFQQHAWSTHIWPRGGPRGERGQNPVARMHGPTLDPIFHHVSPSRC